jgi:hypothetical protein
VIRRDRWRGGEKWPTVGGSEVEDLVGAPVLEDPSTPRAVRVFGRFRERAADDRSDLLRIANRDHRPRVEQTPPLDPLGDVALGLIDDRDVAIVAGAGVVAERQEPMPGQHQTLHVPGLLEELRGPLGELEPGHDVGDEHEPLPVDLAHERLGVRLVRDRQDRVGVRVIDVAVRKEGVEQRLYGRVGSIGVHETSPQLRHHRLVVEPLEIPQAPKPRQKHRGESLGLDRGQVPAALLDVQDLDLVTEKVRRRRLDGRIPPAVKDEVRVGADQSRSVDAQRERLAVLGVATAVLVRLRIDPSGLHALKASRSGLAG